jgi:hypothetical protein
VSQFTFLQREWAAVFEAASKSETAVRATFAFRLPTSHLGKHRAFRGEL